ncbi:MAG: hypothetical protein F9K23_00680 [Bacteroidetes bacterium]|nr:MAG: hypothetical protein F9K23_00680 [Bacteroidota bacterium]
MFSLSCQITIIVQGGLKKLVFPFAAGVSIESSLKERTATATVSIAKNIRVKGSDLSLRPIGEVVKTGDKVIVELGYDGTLRTEFIGYVRSIVPGPPMQLVCEDEMFLFKRTEVAPATIKGTMADLIAYIAPGYTTDVLDTSLGGPFVIKGSGVTPAKVLNEVEEVYGLQSFFRLINGQPVLTVGKAYLSEAFAGTKPVQYKLYRNIIKQGLELQQAEDVKIKVSVKSKQTGGKVLKAKFTGDEGGELREFAAPGLTQERVEEIAKELYKGAKTDRFTGSYTTFGLPYIQHGMSAHVVTDGYEIAETTNYVEAVNTTWGINGFRRDITLGPKVTI